MYAAFYKLKGRPFQLSPDPRFYFASSSHKKAMAYLAYGLNEREGFIVVTGDVGAGKTTLVGHLLAQIDRQKFIYGHVVTSQLEADDALRMVASAFGLAYKGNDKATLLRTIESFLLDARRIGKHVLLVVDEVQNMPSSAIEELRMLSNFQLDGRPLFQCFLLGQHQFRRIIAGDDMEQLRQRVIASCHLEALSAAETREYIEHRMNLVGWRNDPAFTDKAFERIHAHSGGVPRRINNLCSRLLLFGALEDLHAFDESVVEQVAQELAREGTQHSSFQAEETLGIFGGGEGGLEETVADLQRRVQALKSGR
jgi:putative secretion ATPase (PEP-CTERM system associated)